MKQKAVYVGKVAALFREGYNCAQSVLLAMQDFWNERKPLEPKIASAFGGGIGKRGSLCGALTGGVITIGQKYGSNKPIANNSNPIKVYIGFTDPIINGKTARKAGPAQGRAIIE